MIGRHVEWTLPGSVLAALASACVAWTSAQDVQAQNAPTNPFGGQWSLKFSVDTRPGGETVVQPQVVTSPYHLHLSAEKQLFSVSQDGTFSWQEPNCGRLQVDIRTTFPGGSSAGSQDRGVTLKASGSVSEKRTLQLDLQWTPTDGRTTASSSGNWWLTFFSVSADGQTQTLRFASNLPVSPPLTQPVAYDSATWTLQPQSIEKQELSPDVVREVVAYAARRNVRFGADAATVPVTQRIEVKQTRQLKLVPRG